MDASPHPTELLKLLDLDRMVESDRNLFCDHYVACLDEAVSNNWVSWTCANCLLATVESRPSAAEDCGMAT